MVKSTMKLWAGLFVVGIMAGGALQTAFLVQPHNAGQLAGSLDLRIARSERGIVGK